MLLPFSLTTLIVQFEYICSVDFVTAVLITVRKFCFFNFTEFEGIPGEIGFFPLKLVFFWGKTITHDKIAKKNFKVFSHRKQFISHLNYFPCEFKGKVEMRWLFQFTNMYIFVWIIQHFIFMGHSLVLSLSFVKLPLKTKE